MNIPRLLIFDPDDYTASVLQDMLALRGFVAPVVGEEAHLATEARRHRPDIIVFNFHFGRAATLEALTRLRHAAPQLAIMALAAPGAATRDLRDWMARTGSIDAVVEKPLNDDRFDAALREIAAIHARREAADQAAAFAAPRLARPDPARPTARLIELAVLQTDVRRVADPGCAWPPEACIDAVNALLAAQSDLVRSAQGRVLKSGGSGLVATFSGAARAHLALRCALQLRGIAARGGDTPAPQFGIGVCSGLVLAGFIGHGPDIQYDITGATVDTAARLCRVADDREILTNGATLESARAASAPIANRRVPVPGLREAVYAITPPPAVPAQSAAVATLTRSPA